MFFGSPRGIDMTDSSPKSNECFNGDLTITQSHVSKLINEVEKTIKIGKKDGDSKRWHFNDYKFNFNY